MIRNLDIRYSRSYCPFYITLAKVQTQGFNLKKSKPEKFRLKESKLAKGKTSVSLHFKSTKPKKIYHIDKKKEYFTKKQD